MVNGQHLLAGRASNPFLYLTTTGRRTGRAHRIEIWFAVHAGRLCLLSGGGRRTDSVRNLQANPHVTVELGDETEVGLARVLEAGTADDQLARRLLLTRYAHTEDDLDAWGRTSVPVVIEFPADANDPGTGRSGDRGPCPGSEVPTETRVAADRRRWRVRSRRYAASAGSPGAGLHRRSRTRRCRYQLSGRSRPTLRTRVMWRSRVRGEAPGRRRGRGRPRRRSRG